MSPTVAISLTGVILIAVNLAYFFDGALTKSALRDEWARMLGLLAAAVLGLLLGADSGAGVLTQIIIGVLAASASALYAMGWFRDGERRAAVGMVKSASAPFLGLAALLGAAALKISGATGLFLSPPVYAATLYFAASVLFMTDGLIGRKYDADRASTLLMVSYGGLVAAAMIFLNFRALGSPLRAAIVIALCVSLPWLVSRLSKRSSRKLLRDVADGIAALREGRVPSMIPATGGQARDIAEVVGTLIWAVKNNQDELSGKMIELEEKDKARHEFLQNISHELRTPLMGVIGHADLLKAVGEKKKSRQNVPASPFDDDEERYIRRIKEEGHHLLNIINDLLEYSKAESGQLKLFPRTLNVGMILAEVGRSVKPYARRNQIELKVDARDGYVSADPARMKQALFHVVNNALKFTPRGGSASLSVNAPPDGKGQVEIVVEDTGMGISEEALNRLFKGFRQGDGSASREHGGLGVGLPLSRSIVEAHGGKLNMVSEPGKGSRVTITLPAAASPSDAPDVPGIVSGKLLLLLSSDRVLGEIVREQLRHTSLTVGLVFKPDEVWSVVRGRKPDVLLVGVSEAETTVGAVLESLKSNPATASVPKLAIVDEGSGFEGSDGIEILTRPFEREQLIGMIKRCLSNSLQGKSSPRVSRAN